MTEQEPRRSGGMVDVAYEDTGPVDCHSSIDLQTLKDKCVIITGGRIRLLHIWILVTYS